MNKKEVYRRMMKKRREVIVMSIFSASATIGCFLAVLQAWKIQELTIKYSKVPIEGLTMEALTLLTFIFTLFTGVFFVNTICVAKQYPTK